MLELPLLDCSRQQTADGRRAIGLLRRPPPPRRQIDATPLVRRLPADRFAARHIELATDVQFRGPVLIDEARIYRVFLNLADNARKAMGRGGRFEITVASMADRSCCGLNRQAK